MSYNDPGVRRLFVWLVVSLAVLIGLGRLPAFFPPAAAQDAAKGPATAATSAGEQPGAAEDRNDSAAEGQAKKPAGTEMPPLDPLTLMKAGGFELAAIGLVSIVAMAFAVERMLALRRRRVIPGQLVSGLWRVAAQPGGVEPRQIFNLCQQYPSTLSTVVTAALQKTGRPNSEMEAAVAEAGQREATRLYANVRWQNLAFNLAPMLGLLGTIRGVIVAFHGTANLPANMNKTVYLADGIYQALVNTFAGIAVAVPAAIFAHLLEGRIMKLMTEVDDLVRGLLPQLERFEGRLRGGKGPQPASPSEPAAKQPAVQPQ